MATHSSTCRSGSDSAPLSGIRVLEFGAVAAGPYAGLLLADMGADVVKVESPKGDDLRRWPPLVNLSSDDEFSLNFTSLNRNKRSVCLDLKTELGHNRALALIKNCDVLIVNFRPGVMEKLHLGFESLSQLNDRLIYCAMSGYGSAGPRARNGAYDVVIQAESGLMSVTGPTNGDEAKCGVPVADFATGQYAAFAAVSAYLSNLRSISPTPKYIDISMLESILAISALQTSEYWGTQRSPKRRGTAHPRNAPYQAFTASDRAFVLAAGNDRLWHSVCETVDRPEWKANPKFATQAGRVANMEVLEALLNQEFSRHTAIHWLTALQARGVPSALIRTFQEALDDDQLQQRNFIQDIPLPDGTHTHATVMPLSINGRNNFGLRPPPLLGEHTESVIAEWTESAIDDNRDNPIEAGPVPATPTSHLEGLR